jgi:hypothetical protein
MTPTLLACSLPLVTFLSFLVLVGGAFWWIRRHGQARRALWDSTASQLGFELVEGRNVPFGDPAQAALLARFGIHGPDALAHRRHLASRRDRSTYRLGDTTQLGDGGGDLTLAQIEDPTWRLPPFSVRPRGGTSGLFGPFGPDAIPFTEDPAFDRTFEVLSPDPEAIRALLTPDARAALLVHGPRWFWEGCEQSFAVTDGGLSDAREAKALLAGLEVVARTLVKA